MKKKPKLILLRHGESEWNKQNLFTGWVDVSLSSKGIEEAIEAGKRLASEPIDLIIVSSLARAQQTAMIALSQHKGGKTPIFIPFSSELPGNKPLSWSAIHSSEAKEKSIPVLIAWEMNERMYGSLQGCNKKKTEEKYGKERVHQWRRSYDIAPPDGESLKDTVERVIPFFQKQILPELIAGKNLLIVAHGNSLRGLIMEIEKLSGEEILHREVQTGQALVYEYNLNDPNTPFHPCKPV